MAAFVEALNFEELISSLTFPTLPLLFTDSSASIISSPNLPETICGFVGILILEDDFKSSKSYPLLNVLKQGTLPMYIYSFNLFI